MKKFTIKYIRHISFEGEIETLAPSLSAARDNVRRDLRNDPEVRVFEKQYHLEAPRIRILP